MVEEEISINPLFSRLLDDGGFSLTTLSQWITKEEALSLEELKDISLIIMTLTTDFKIISNYLATPEPLRWRTKINRNGRNISENANSIIIENLSKIDSVFALISSMNSEPIFLSEAGKYIIFIIPLEGDADQHIVAPIGSIFSIYKRTQLKKGERRISRKKQILRRGVDALISAIVVYGKTTTLLIANSPNRVLEFFLDSALGDFIMVSDDVKAPTEGYVYYTDEKISPYWNKKICQIIYSRKITTEGRYCYYRLLSSKAAMAYKIIKNGGLYVLPACTLSNNDSALLVFEANPIAHLMKASGGLATTGVYSPLELFPENIDDRVPLFAGSRREIDFVIKVLNFERSVE